MFRIVQLVSLNVGLPRDVEWEGRIVHTGIWKEPVQGRRTVRRLNIDGDGQGDTAGHGGVNRPVFVYQLDSYRYWEDELGRDDFSYGQFGENFTVDGLADADVCIGDRYRIGTALFEVSQPRVTCYRLGLRMREPRMPSLVVAHHRPGFYLRVLEEGEVGAGDAIERVERGPEQMSVADIDALLYLPGHAPRDLTRALNIPALSPGWQGSFRELLEQSETPKPAWAGMRDMRVTAIERESANVISIRLVPVEGHAVPARPGQYLTVKIGSLVRTYSLSDTPNTESYRISVKREPHGAASEYLHTKLRVGDVLEAGAPRGAFVLREGERPVVLISAGVGATPVLAMLHALVEAQPTRPVWWLHGARNHAEHSFEREVLDLLALLPDAHAIVRYSETDGRLTADALAGVPADADFYLCGPAPFMADLTAALDTLGVAPERISAEAFGPAAAITPGIAAASARTPHPPSGTPGTGPDVSFSRSNLTVAWDPSFPNLLEFAEACDVPVQWSCRTGVCRTCETGLIDGEVGFRPDPLEPATPGTTLLCCSQPRDAVTLDL